MPTRYRYRASRSSTKVTSRRANVSNTSQHAEHRADLGVPLARARPDRDTLDQLVDAQPDDPGRAVTKREQRRDAVAPDRRQ